MKEATAYKKIRIMKRAHQEYAEAAVIDGRQYNLEALQKMKKIRGYVRRLILKKRLDPTVAKSLFFHKEYKDIVNRLNKRSCTGQTHI